MKKRNLILGAILAAQVLLVIIIYNSGNRVVKSQTTLTDFEPANVVSLEIADSYGSSTKLVKQDGRWLIDPPEDYPGDRNRIESALKKLSNIRSDRLVTSSKGSHGRLRVSDEKYNRLINIEESDGKSLSLYLGTSQGQGVYARRGESDDVFFVNKLSSWEFATSPRSWWKTSIVDIATDTMNELDITNSNGTVKLQRNEKEMWVDGSGKLLDQDKVKKLLLAVKNIRLSEYVKKDSGKKLEKAEAAIRIIPSKGKEITLEIGPEEKSERLVRVSGLKHLVKVRSSELKKVLELKNKDLMSEKKKEEAQKGGEKNDGKAEAVSSSGDNTTSETSANTTH